MIKKRGPTVRALGALAAAAFDTNGDGVQNFPGDTINSAKAANGIIQKTLDFDLNGDGVVNFPGDTILSAKMTNHVGGICPP